MAVDRVEQLLHKLTQALNDAGIDYAIIGGNAVAAWVARVDEAAVRSTKDVDVLIRRADLTRVTEALKPVDLNPHEVMGVHMFLEKKNPNPKTGVHVVFASERVRPNYAHAAPDPGECADDREAFRLIDLRHLVEMKLQAYRFIDRAHIQDLMSVGLIDEAIRHALPPDLRERPQAIADEVESEDA